MKKLVLLFVALMLLCTSAWAGTRAYKERDYQDLWCAKANGITEVVLFDKSRVDCIVPAETFGSPLAVEVDFADKWAEGIGQALYYGTITGAKPYVLLISENGDDDNKYISRLAVVAAKVGISWEVIDKETYERYMLSK